MKALITAGVTACVLSWSSLCSAEDCSHCCRICKVKICNVTVGKEEIESNCFECEAVDICIPPVRFWWECGPLRQCGKIRTVNRLTTHSTTKTVCTYDWSVATVCRPCYRKVHRLRCRQLGLGEKATAAQVGLPQPATPDEAVVVIPWSISPVGDSDEMGLFGTDRAVAVPDAAQVPPVADIGR